MSLPVNIFPSGEKYSLPSVCGIPQKRKKRAAESIFGLCFHVYVEPHLAFCQVLFVGRRDKSRFSQTIYVQRNQYMTYTYLAT